MDLGLISIRKFGGGAAMMNKGPAKTESLIGSLHDSWLT
jgi:hypothetical protein|tara:strand:- start:41 stop:157 length:117 start_codon:yes stop_codon:yes gene_type:complete